MAFELRQELKLSQQLVMTPQLQLAIKLLQMCKMELVDVIQQEMVENPMLEEVPESEESADKIENIEEIPDTKQDTLNDAKEQLAPEIKEYIQSSGGDSYVSYHDREEKESFETTLTRSSSLVDHLTWQLHMQALPDDEQKIGELIIGNLNPDGYLQVPLIEIAKTFLANSEANPIGR